LIGLYGHSLTPTKRPTPWGEIAREDPDFRNCSFHIV